MAIDWLDLGFNLVIIFAVIGILGYTLWQVWTKIKKEKGKENEEELDNMLKIQKLVDKK